MYQFQEAMQDSMLGLKRLYQSILGKDTRIEDVKGFENAYLAENRMSSVNAAEQHEYYVTFMNPLIAAVGELAGTNEAKRQELTDYMMAKHGLERNEVMANRDNLSELIGAISLQRQFDQSTFCSSSFDPSGHADTYLVE